MKEYRLTDWLPTTKKEMELRGWDELDVVLFSGDAYVDHPSFGAAVIGRLLEAQGLKVAIVPQPNWRDDLRDFKKMGRPYKAVVGSLEDNEAFEELGRHLKVLQLIEDLKYMDIGFVGHTFRGMYDIEVDKTKIKGVFGPNVLYLDVNHLINIWEALTDDEISEYVEVIKKELPYSIEGIDDEDMRKSVSVGLAVRKLIKQFNIDGLTLLGQHHVEVATRASADLSFYCAENDGCMTSHEGDLANLVMKYILNKLTGDLPVFLEWSAFDIATDTLLLTHHGVVDPKIHAADQNKCRITPSPEKWDFTGHGMSVEYMAKPGKVTLACLIDDKEGWKLLLSGGECLELTQAPSFAPQFRFKHESLTVKEYAILELMLLNPTKLFSKANLFENVWNVGAETCIW